MDDVLDFAMQMEKDGKKLYQDAATRCGDKGLQSIFNLLADAEQEHYDLLRAMKRGVDPTTTLTDVFAGTKNLFQQMADRGEELNLKAAQMDIYKKACDIERRATDFYREKAKAAKGKDQIALLLALAAEEEKHVRIVENIIEFVSRPMQYLDDAEWNNMERE
jgi:rubrerythrin